MKLIDAYVVWTPSRDVEGDYCGEVFVGTERDAVRAIEGKPRFSMWHGVCAGSSNLPMHRELMMFITQNTLIVRDGLDPMAVHREFLKIDEYRRRISPDTPGAD